MYMYCFHKDPNIVFVKTYWNNDEHFQRPLSSERLENKQTNSYLGMTIYQNSSLKTIRLKNNAKCVLFSYTVTCFYTALMTVL